MENLSSFATTVPRKVTKATIIQPSSEIENATVEYCVSSGYVLIKNPAEKKAMVTHISNVVLELPME